MVHILYNVIVERLAAITASSVTYLPPVVALIIGWAFVGEAVSVRDIAGISVILAGVVLLRLGAAPGPTR